jgi:hypothetical protein
MRRVPQIAMALVFLYALLAINLAIQYGEKAGYSAWRMAFEYLKHSSEYVGWPLPSSLVQIFLLSIIFCTITVFVVFGIGWQVVSSKEWNTICSILEKRELSRKNTASGTEISTSKNALTKTEQDAVDFFLRNKYLWLKLWSTSVACAIIMLYGMRQIGDDSGNNAFKLAVEYWTSAGRLPVVQYPIFLMLLLCDAAGTILIFSLLGMIWHLITRKCRMTICAILAKC